MSRTSLALALLCALAACDSPKHSRPSEDAGLPADDASDLPGDDAGDPPDDDAAPPSDDAGDLPADDSGAPRDDAGVQDEVRVAPSPDLICTFSCLQILVGDTVQLVATDAEDEPLTVDTWSSAAENIATTSQTGVVTGVAPGDVEISAKVGDKTGHATVHVVSRPATRVVIEPGKIELAAVDATLQLTAKAYDDQDNLVPDATLLWFSANPQVAEIDAEGKITAKGKGTGAVYASTDTGASGGATVIVGGSVLSDKPGLELTEFAGGMNFDCGIEPGGKTYCWGWNYYGTLGNGTRGSESEYFPTPLSVFGDHLFHGITGSESHTCALDDKDAAFCWGSNGNGELGVSDPEVGGITIPIAVEGGLEFSSISAGYDHSCALQKGTGKAYCFGLGGTVGDGTFDDRNQPTAVSGGLTFAELHAGFDSSCGLTSDGKAYCWGDNYFGQSGDGKDGEQSSYEAPVAVVGNHTFVALDMLASHACAITKDGETWCWGRNESSQLGDGSDSEGKSTPVQVNTSEKFVQITVGVWHSCGLTAAGDAFCWGLNANGQLGDGTSTSRLAPVQVVGDLPFKTIEAGGFHTCGIATDGQAYCWGENGDGRLGTGFGGEGAVSIVPWPVAAPEVP